MLCGNEKVISHSSALFVLAGINRRDDYNGLLLRCRRRRRRRLTPTLPHTWMMMIPTLLV